MSSSNNRPASVFFCDRSALQILRAAQARHLDLPKSVIREPPTSPPRQADVLAAVEQAEALFPGLRLDRPVRLLVGDASLCRSNDLFVARSCTTALSRGSFLRVAPGVYASSPQLAFLRAGAQGASDIALAELGFELCGTYRTLATCRNDSFNIPALTTARDLYDYATRNCAAKGARSAMRALRLVADGSASPRETKLAILLGAPLTQGGAGLGMPVMNFEVEASREASLIARRASFRCDLCWPDARIDVEYQSRAVHSNEESRISDSRRTNALEAMGWNVVEVTNDELDSMTACDVIAKRIRKDLGKDPRIRTGNYYDRQLRLRSELGLPIDSLSLRG